MKRYPLAIQIRKYLIPYILVVVGAIGVFSYAIVTHSLKHTFVTQSGTITNLFIQSMSNDLLMGSFTEVYRSCSKFSSNSGVNGIEVVFGGKHICKVLPEDKESQTFEKSIYFDENKENIAASVKVYLSTADLDRALDLVNIITLLFAAIVSVLTYLLTVKISRKITDPISALSDTVSNKDLEGIITTLEKDHRPKPEEVYQLQQSVKDLATRLRKSLIELQKVATYKAIAGTTQMMAHDIRRPFTMLREMIDVINSSVDKGDTKRVISDYSKNVIDLVDKVDGLLEDVMSIDSKKEIKKTRIYLDRVIDLAIKDVDDQFKRKVSLVRASENNVVIANEGKISRVISN